MSEDSTQPNDPLAEYQTAQQSAEHHDQLVWSTTGILWGASLVLLGFVLSRISDPPVPRVLLTVTSALGVFLLAILSRCVWIWQHVKRRKYAVCHQLEGSHAELLPNKHHTAEKEHWPNCFKMTALYYTLMGLFALVWVYVIVALWCPSLS
jgi:hypothetical protein